MNSEEKDNSRSDFFLKIFVDDCDLCLKILRFQSKLPTFLSDIFGKLKSDGLMLPTIQIKNGRLVMFG